MCEDSAMQSLAKYLINQNLNWNEWLQNFGLKGQAYTDSHVFRSKLLNSQIEEQDAQKLCTSPLIQNNGQIDLQALECQLKCVYLVRLQRQKEIKEGFQLLAKLLASTQFSLAQTDILRRELFGEGTINGFIIRCQLKKIPRSTAELMATSFLNINGQLDPINFTKVFNKLTKPVFKLNQVAQSYRINQSSGSPTQLKPQTPGFKTHRKQILLGASVDLWNQSLESRLTPLGLNDSLSFQNQRLKTAPNGPNRQGTAPPGVNRLAIMTAQTKRLHNFQVSHHTVKNSDYRLLQTERDSDWQQKTEHYTNKKFDFQHTGDYDVCKASVILKQNLVQRDQPIFLQMEASQDFILYQNPHMHSERVTKVFKGAQLLVDLAVTGFWCQVKVLDKQGWMLKTNFKKNWAPLRQSPKKEVQTIQTVKPLASTVSQASTIFAIPLDAPEKALSKRVYDPLAIMLMKEDRSKKRLFNVYDNLRLQEVYEVGNNKPLRHRTITEGVSDDFKDLAYQKIQQLRLGQDILCDEKARVKKIKFLNFCCNLALKGALRKWKDVVFGFQGGDPRLKLLLILERDKIRQQYYGPVRKMRENIKEMHRARQKEINERARQQRDEVRQRESSRRRSVDSV